MRVLRHQIGDKVLFTLRCHGRRLSGMENRGTVLLIQTPMRREKHIMMIQQGMLANMEPLSVRTSFLLWPVVICVDLRMRHVMALRLRAQSETHFSSMSQNKSSKQGTYFFLFTGVAGLTPWPATGSWWDRPHMMTQFCLSAMSHKGSTLVAAVPAAGPL